MAYKLIAIDVDDTLLNSRGEITPRTKSAITAAQKKGVGVLLATGRAFPGIKKQIAELGLTLPSVCCGGSRIVDKEKGVIHSVDIPSNTVRSIIAYAEEVGIYYQIYMEDSYSYPAHAPETDIYRHFCGYDGYHVPYLKRIEDITCAKVIFIADEARVASLQPLARLRFPELRVVCSKPIYLEFYNPASSKGAALKFLAEKYGIDKSEILAIGDSPIDISMFQYAGGSACMANGSPEAKAAAAYITADMDNDGVALAIERYIL